MPPAINPANPAASCPTQPLPPADILAAGAAAFAAGGKLRAGNGVGLGVEGALGPHSLGLQSYYAPWILADLAHWSHTGISRVRASSTV